MPEKRGRPFNTDAYVATAGHKREIIRLKAKQVFSSQGNPGDCLFYLWLGRGKLTIVSNGGKEATFPLLAPGDFFGEECMAGQNQVRTTTATSISVCVVVKIATEALTRVLHPENAFSDLLVHFLALHRTKTLPDLLDQLSNNSERRLARSVLLIAEYADAACAQTLISPVAQGSPAEMIGTTRSLGSFSKARLHHLRKPYPHPLVVDDGCAVNSTFLLTPPDNIGRRAQHLGFTAHLSPVLRLSRCHSPIPIPVAHKGLAPAIRIPLE